MTRGHQSVAPEPGGGGRADHVKDGPPRKA